MSQRKEKLGFGGASLLSRIKWVENRAKQQRTFPFLHLPGELRNKIYAFACDTVSISRSPQPRFTGTALRLVCKQIAHEAASYLYHPYILHLTPDCHASHLSGLLSSGALLHQAYRCVEMPVEMVKHLSLDYDLLETTELRVGWMTAFWGKLAPRLRFARLERVAVWRDSGEEWCEETRHWVDGVLREVFGKGVDVVCLEE